MFTAVTLANAKRDSESLYEYDLEGSILFLFLKPDVFVYLGEDYPSVFGVYDDTAESIPDNFDFKNRDSEYQTGKLMQNCAPEDELDCPK